MEQLYTELERILCSEVEIHVALVETAHAFNKSLRENNVPEIHSITLRHDELICQIEKLEEQRIEYSVLIAKKLGMKTKEPKLANLIEHAPLKFKQRLGDLHNKLKKEISDLSKLTVSNQLLLENAMNIINCTFAFIKQSQKKFLPYGATRKASSSYNAFTMFNRTV
ncbi:MAG: flagellar export chaperone FlgN [Fibrobacterota bacterium]|jgi:flagellar biosynthesis/type III secretory pathway chaperone